MVSMLTCVFVAACRSIWVVSLKFEGSTIPWYQVHGLWLGESVLRIHISSNDGDGCGLRGSTPSLACRSKQEGSDFSVMFLMAFGSVVSVGTVGEEGGTSRW
eukprot:jgi/Botrbrau1/10161/Bobra.0121s0013.1